MVTYKGCQKRGDQIIFGNGPHKEEGEEDDHERPGLITSRRPWQPGTLMSKISRTVRGGEEVARNVRKGCRTLDEEEEEDKLTFPSLRWSSSLFFMVVQFPGNSIDYHFQNMVEVFFYFLS
jgi:hypothetical protein